MRPGRRRTGCRGRGAAQRDRRGGRGGHDPALHAPVPLVLVTTGYVGLSTVVAALCLPLAAWLFDAGPERMVFAICIGLFLAWTHRANLVRLWHGNESRFERARLLYRLYGRSRY